jgi:VWFA-related protein
MIKRRHFCFAPAVFAAFAQTPDIPPVIKSNVRVVDLPVVVLDRKTGRPVTGLTQADFEILEKGKARAVASFQEVDLSAAKPAVASAAAGGNAIDKPVAVIVLDAYNSRPEDRHYAAKAVADVILASPDAAYWGVVALSGNEVRVVHNFFDLPSLLLDRLKKNQGQSDPFEGTGMRDLKLSGPIADTNEGQWSELRRRFARTLGAIQQIGEDLGQVPGRKSIIWMTSGMPLRAGLMDDSRVWHETNERLSNWNVSVYAIDTSGVLGNPSLLAEGGGSRGTVARVMSRDRSAMTEILPAIAERTGGRAYMGTNNLAKGIRAAVAESVHYYQLTFASGVAPSRNAGLVPIRVKVKSRDVEVRHREGYFPEIAQP